LPIPHIHHHHLLPRASPLRAPLSRRLSHPALQARQAFIESQLRTQRELARDQAQIAALQTQLAEQNARLEMLKARDPQAAEQAARATPEQQAAAAKVAAEAGRQ
jgi:hypothetical protein